MIPTPEIIQSGWVGILLQSCGFVITACFDQVRLVSLSPMACPATLMPDQSEKKHFAHKSGRSVPDKLQYTTPCQGGETDLYFFINFCP